MLVKLSLAVLAILNLYLLITVSKESRHDMIQNLKLIPSRLRNIFPKRERVYDDTELVMETAATEIVPLPKTTKMDFTEQCKRYGVPCENGKESLRCYHEVKYSKARCMVCECSICEHGKCPPAKKG